VTHPVDRFKQNRTASKRRPGSRNHPKPADTLSSPPPAKNRECLFSDGTAGTGVTDLNLRDVPLKGLEHNQLFRSSTSRGQASVETARPPALPRNSSAVPALHEPDDHHPGPALGWISKFLDRANDLKQPWPFTSPIVAVDDLQRPSPYAPTPPLTAVRKLRIRPTDEKVRTLISSPCVRFWSCKENISLQSLS